MSIPAVSVPALATGLSIATGLNNPPRGGRTRPEDDPLSYLTPNDWRLVSHAVGFAVTSKGKLFPMLAFQIGWDRQSNTLPAHSEVSVGYLRSMAANYRDTDRESTLGIQEQIAAAISYLQHCEQSAPRLDVLA